VEFELVVDVNSQETKVESVMAEMRRQPQAIEETVA
jgi:hypothetical protein